jgi:hypothetical protein
LPHKEDTAIQPPGCTTGCTNEPKPHQPATVEALAAALLNLSADDRARLVALLLSQPQDKPKE